ncbi:MAG: 30S ribosomal protein S8 [Bacteroidetes bacterium SW_10_40_5]|nr:MAG: 30S ribosomal protein S8 [Bacteroidetes bacterium SW_10_40_5]
MNDPIADYLTRIRNAITAKKRVLEMPASNMKKEITKIFFDKGYILNFKFEDGKGPQGTIKIALKYDYQSGTPAITDLGKISKPGLRRYSKAATIPRIVNGLGVAILSTSKGVMSDKEARKLNEGGELVCYVY